MKSRPSEILMISVLSRLSDKAVIEVTYARSVAIEEFPIVISLLTVAEEALAPFPRNVLLLPVVRVLPALYPIDVL